MTDEVQGYKKYDSYDEWKKAKRDDPSVEIHTGMREILEILTLIGLAPPGDPEGDAIQEFGSGRVFCPDGTYRSITYEVGPPQKNKRHLANE